MANIIVTEQKVYHSLSLQYAVTEVSQQDTQSLLLIMQILSHNALQIHPWLVQHAFVTQDMPNLIVLVLRYQPIGIINIFRHRLHTKNKDYQNANTDTDKREPNPSHTTILPQEKKDNNENGTLPNQSLHRK